MKAEGVHEGCIEQIQRLFEQRLYTGKEVPTDDTGRIRIDDWEMRDDIQEKVAKLMQKNSHSHRNAKLIKLSLINLNYPCHGANSCGGRHTCPICD